MSGEQGVRDRGGWARRDVVPWRVRVLDVLVVVATLALGAWASWPVYGSVRGPLATAAGLVLGGGVAWWSRRGRWTWWQVTVATLVAYVVLAIPVAIPSALRELPSNLGYGARELVTAPVTAWKELATTPLPVGSFGSLLVPAFLVALVATVVALSIVWRGSRGVAWAAVPLLLPLVLGVAWGPREVSVTLGVLGLHVSQPREVAWGGAWLVLVVCWLTLRGRWSVRQVRYLDAAGRSRGSSGGVVRRAALGAGTVLVAVLVAVVVAPGWAGDRTVVRSVVQPQTVAQPLGSPLSDFRSYFEPGALDAPLFTVTGLADGARLRVATLGSYDGDVYQVMDASEPQAGLPRLAFRLPDPGPEQASGPVRTATVTSDGYTGPWVPTAGRPVEVTFDGPVARRLASALFADPATGSVLEVAPRAGGVQGIVPGDSFRVAYREPAEAPDSAQPVGRSPLVVEDDAPEMFAWLDAQGSGGATVGDVRELVAAMMERSYLGHSLQEPVAASGERTWLTALEADGPYAFRPSYAGHGLARVDDGVFGAMNRAAARCGTQDRCASTVGDQEQYAVAAALLAEAKGFPARVVLGATVPSDGVVRGQDMTAWTEVQAADGRWAAIDIVPRTDNEFVPDDTTTTPQRVPTTVRRQEAQELEPPAQKPQTGEAPTARDSPAQHAAAASWWPLVRKVLWGVLALAVLLAPFVGVLVAKGARRRRRRRAGDVETRITGGWEEYVDAHLDAGAPPPGTRTRSEVADLYGGRSGALLAQRADRAVFGDLEPEGAEAEDYWRIVDEELADVRSAQGWWRRRRSALSLRSVRKAP